MSSKETLSIFEALENLNTIVEAERLDEIEVTEDAHILFHKQRDKEDYWTPVSGDEATEEAIKKTFQSVLHYLKSYYQKMKEKGDQKKLVEGINTIMVLVGEATEKLDRFGALFKEKVTNLEEYKELQQFYRSKVIKESFKEFKKIPLPSIRKVEEKRWEKAVEKERTQAEVTEDEIGIHLLNDIDVIKRDHLYELFYIKNESGQSFDTYQLARTIRLACDFGEYSKEYFGEDPLLQIKNWEDRSLHLLSKKMLSASKKWIDRFYKEAFKYREMDLVMLVHNALMALMLASNPRNLIRQFALKSCHRYFADFQFFLREALLNRDYQKFLLFSPPATQPFFLEMIELIHSLCYNLYSIGMDLTELKEAISEIVEQGDFKKEKTISGKLISAFNALSKTLEKHPSGPIFKAIDLIHEEETKIFDPLFQGNIPNREGTFHLNSDAVHMLRIPCPIVQEYIHHAFISEEFKTYLHACKSKVHHGKHLIINLQDRTSWREHARSKAIEGLGKQAEFAEVLTIVTLAKDTDFYNQSGPYHDLRGAKEFISQFKEHLMDETTGYLFPVSAKSELFPNFIEDLIDSTHRVFFNGKDELAYHERLDFIELVYAFVTLKLIEIVKPQRVSLISKDSLDVEGTSSAALFILLGMNEKAWGETEWSQLETILFGPTLLNRERVVHPERFDRLYHIVQRLEEKKNYKKEFQHLFEKTTLSAKPTFDI